MSELAHMEPNALVSLGRAIRAEHEACEADAKSAVEHAIRAGEMLVEAKEQLQHGQWMPWLAENFPGHANTASNYMRLASNSQRVVNSSSVREALAELAEPRSAPSPTPEPASPSPPPAEGFGSEDGWSPTAPDNSAVDGPELVDAEVVDDDPKRDMGVHFSSASDEWATPQPVFDMLAREFPFDLDVCALDSSAKCANYFTPELDGLAHDWRGVCWMNPPYGREIGKWVAKARESANENGATVVCLLPARVDTGWWWDHCRYGEVRFLRGRLKFGEAKAGAPFPSAVVVFMPDQIPSVQWWDRDVEEAARDAA